MQAEMPQKYWKNMPEARLMIAGEQPGDREDLAGRPFVGLAGRLLDRALSQAGIDRGAVYLTNAVKHFKFEPRGKLIHHNGRRVLLTVHPSHLLRVRDEPAGGPAYARFVAGLAHAVSQV